MLKSWEARGGSFALFDVSRYGLAPNELFADCGCEMHDLQSTFKNSALSSFQGT